jgi:hypothetical protein
VSDVTPLAGMPLKSLRFTPANITRGIEVLRAMTTLQDLGLKHQTTGVGVHTPAEFWKKYDADEFGKPATSSKLFMHDPAFPQWMRDVQALAPQQQIDRVRQKLKDLNPAFDGLLSGNTAGSAPTIENGLVTQLWLNPNGLTDLSPLRAFSGLKRFTGRGNYDKATLSDLSPLAGMQLTHFDCIYIKANDLSPLAGMPLTYLNTDIKVPDLSFLQGMPLTVLYLPHPANPDLSPLTGMPLERFYCYNSRVSDLGPLRGMPLVEVNCSNTPVADLSPLAECKRLTSLHATKTKVTAESVAALQKALPDCKITWDDPAKTTTPAPAAPR